MALSKSIIDAVESQIEKQRIEVDYDTREFTIEFIVKKYTENIDRDENEFYVPDYQREFVWSIERQSKLMESIILGLPIPSMFLAENCDGRCEIVDGSQRIRTFAAFFNDELILNGLERLSNINGMRFSDLPESRKKKIRNTSLRLIFLSEKVSESVKNDLFERINRGSDLLKDMEKRKGIYKGVFADFIYTVCATNEKFKKLTPISKWLINRQEREELILRFFALLDTAPIYNNKKIGIAKFLDDYLYNKNKNFSEDEKQEKQAMFEQMLEVVEKSFQYGFSKDGNLQVSRMYFEALSVGAVLALHENPDLKPPVIDSKQLIRNKLFQKYASGKYKTHTTENIKGRIEFMKNLYLGKENA